MTEKVRVAIFGHHKRQSLHRDRAERDETFGDNRTTTSRSRMERLTESRPNEKPIAATS
ncbi:hypothetical protein [Paenibacillus antri]|uniref:hypothetical protein n=1 Tax=Paenibacillus antri TaxID=2582848 RepID=UPI00130535FD|nr:hypothetical protein [Paenibacillus antri]